MTRLEKSLSWWISIEGSSEILCEFFNHANWKGGVPDFTAQNKLTFSPVRKWFAKLKGWIFGDAEISRILMKNSAMTNF